MRTPLLYANKFNLQTKSAEKEPVAMPIILILQQ